MMLWGQDMFILCNYIVTQLLKENNLMFFSSFAICRNQFMQNVPQWFSKMIVNNYIVIELLRENNFVFFQFVCLMQQCHAGTKNMSPSLLHNDGECRNFEYIQYVILFQSKHGHGAQTT